jgi:hypothetical protein
MHGNIKLYCFITCCLFFAALQANAQKNLVTDGGFEDDLYGWNNGNNVAKITPWDFKSGKNSCVIITSNVDNWIGIDQTVRIPKKVQMFEFSAWIKTVNVVKGKDEWNGAVFSIEFLDKMDKKLGDGVNIARITGDQGWTLSKQAVKIPPGAVSFRILLAMGYASGTMLIDDVSAAAVATDETKS